MRVTRLKLKNWKNFKQVEVALDQRAFFVGPNASGKSNLLDALRFVRDLAATVGGGLQEAVGSRGGIAQLRCFAATRNANIAIELVLGDDEAPERWRYSLEFATDKGRDRPVVVKEQVFDYKRGELICDRPDDDDASDSARLSETALEQVSANKRFRPIADFVASISYLHVVPQIIRDPKRWVGRDDPFGGDLIERMNSTSKRTRDARLKRMEAALQLAVPQFRDLQLEVDTKGMPHLRANYTHWRPQGAWQRQDRFSDGTLRLLGLIWALQEPGGPLLLEEPEMSLNPAVVSRLAPMIARATNRSRRQVLITTHSVDLLATDVALSEVHLLEASEQGTSILSEPELKDVRRLVDGGVPLGEAILPRARAKDVERLPLLELMQQ